MKTMPFHWIVLLAVVLVLCATSGCESDDDYDYVPPSGQGGLVIDNRTREDIEVFVDGERVGRTDDYDDRVFYMKPAVRRVVLSERGGGQTYRDDIDILEQRLTILIVQDGYDEYAVSVRIE